VIACAIIAPLFLIQTTFLKGNFNPFLKIGAAIQTLEFNNITEWVSQIGKLIRSEDKILKGEKDGRINFLLLGMGGPGHDGAYLTDTMILASFQPKEKKVAMVSIPRDLAVPIPGYGWRKINSINAYAEAENRSSGGTAAITTVGEILDIPIHYYVRADFQGFETLIDKLGGVSVYVERSFVDYQYPTDDEKYQTLSFEEGWQTMDGDTALKFVRSRHGTNGEASDFARSRRQQKIILALKEKMLSFSTLLNPIKIQSIFEAVKNSIDTNMEMWEIVRMSHLARDVDTEKIIHQVLSADQEGLLVAANINGAYVLEPRAGNFSEIQFLVKNIFNVSSEINFEDKPEPTRLEIQNGTKITGLASRTAQMLTKFDYEVPKVGNATEQNYERTIIYDLTDGAKNDDLKFLKEKLNAEVSLSTPPWLTNSTAPGEIALFDSPATVASSTDFLIILGKNATF
jgi:LCP family protein required for cell wall assembly